MAPSSSSPSTTTPSLSQQFKTKWNSVPLVTRWVSAICTIIYIWGLILPFNTQYFAFWPFGILNGQIWRIFTGVLIHGGFLHLFFNMSAFIPMGGQMEVSLVGSIGLAFLLIVFTILSGLLIIITGLIAYHIFNYPNILLQPAVGFSGVIFALLVVRTRLLPQSDHQSIFGFFTVPSHIYPWVLLVIISLIMPNASFMGHLAGILAGYIYATGWIDFLFPSPETFKSWEQSWLFRSCWNRSGCYPLSGSVAINPSGVNIFTQCFKGFQSLQNIGLALVIFSRRFTGYRTIGTIEESEIGGPITYSETELSVVSNNTQPSAPTVDSEDTNPDLNTKNDEPTDFLDIESIEFPHEEDE